MLQLIVSCLWCYDDDEEEDCPACRPPVGNRLPDREADILVQQARVEGECRALGLDPSCPRERQTCGACGAVAPRGGPGGIERAGWIWDGDTVLCPNCEDWQRVEGGEDLCRNCKRLGAQYRGICLNCRRLFRREIKAGQTSWRSLVLRGIVLPRVPAWGRNRWDRGRRQAR